MGLKTRGKSKIRELVKEALDETKEEEFPKDPTIEDEDDDREITNDFIPGDVRQKRKDEVVIDQLLQDINGKQGYFLKLKKEVRPNEYMLMKVIESEWRRWADIETAVADIVKEHTKHAPHKWGSGAYRVEIACKTGMRGKRYDPIDMYINADEELVAPQVNPTVVSPQANVIDPSTQVASQMETLANLVSMIKQVMPQSPDPTAIQNQIAQAFQQGMALKSNESNSTTTLLATMMATMMGAMKDLIIAQKPSNIEVKQSSVEEQLAKLLGVMKDFGVIGPPKEIKEKSVIDFANELKALGIDLFKRDEPIEQINKLKQIASLAADFMGMQSSNDRPSILEKLVDVLGPAVPEMVKNVKETFDKAVTAQQIASQNIEKAKLLGVQPQQNGAGVSQVQNQYQGVGNQEQIRQFFDQLYEAIDRNNKMFYPIIYTSLIQDTSGVGLVNDIISQKKGAKELVELLQTYGGEKFRDQTFINTKLVGYANGFILWLRNFAVPEQPKVKESYDVWCNVCGTVYGYDNEQEYLADENKKCENTGCVGTLEPVKAKV